MYGQAMTEFIVVVTAVVLPLFVIVPLLGKWIHTGFAADMAGRYASWERTVWFDEDKGPKGTEKSTLAEMSQSQLERAAFVRFFSESGSDLQVSTVKLKTNQLDVLHKTLDGDELFGLGEMKADENQLSTPDELALGSFKFAFGPYDVIKAFNDLIGVALAPFDWLGLTDDFGRIEHAFNGYFVSSLNVPLNNSGLSGHECGLAGAKADGASGCVGGLSEIAITTNSGIIADGWNAQNDKHFRDRVDDFALGAILQGKPLRILGEVLDYDLFGVKLEPSIGNLLKSGIGHVGIDPIPEGLPECNLLGGVCHYYQEPE